MFRRLFFIALPQKPGHEPLMIADIDYPHKYCFEPKPDKSRFQLPCRTPNIHSFKRIILINTLISMPKAFLI